MAQALRTVWLEPEENQEPLTPHLQPRRRQRPARAGQQGPIVVFAMISLVAFVIGCVVAYVNSFASIARYEYQRQAYSVELRQMQENCARLQLEIARLENTPRITQVAKGQNLEFPTVDRVHYMHVADNTPQTTNAGATPDVRQRSWLARSGRQMIAMVHDVGLRLRRGPGTPAYAQE